MRVLQDPGELHAVNTTTQPELIAFMINAANEHVNSVVPGVSQYEGLDWSLVPCCNKAFNATVRPWGVRLERRWPT